MTDTWDLTKLFKTDKAFETALTKLQNNFKKKPFKKFEKKLNVANRLKEFLDLYFDLQLQLDRIYTYTQLKFHGNLADNKNQTRHQLAKGMIVDFDTQTSFWKAELLLIEKKQLQALVKKPKLKEYEHLLERLLKLKQHTLSQKEEMLLSRMEKPMQYVPAAFEAMNNVDLEFGKVKDGKGKLQPVTHGLYLTYLQNNDRTLRKNAWECMHGAYKKMENTLANLLTAHIEKHNFLAKTRSYKNALEAAIKPNFIDEKVYHNLIKATNKGLPLLHEYLQLKKKFLKLKNIHPYDVYALGNSKIKKTSYPKAKEFVVNSAMPLGKSYQQKLRAALDKEGWVDVYERKYKRSSAYSSGSYGAIPYVLLNYCGSISDIFTLSHEMGHSMHSYYSWKTQPYPYSSYPIFLAEIASTFHEQLLFDELLESMKTKQEKIHLLVYNLEQMRATFFRQTMFAEFELQVHEMNEKGPLTVQMINQLYYELNRRYFGKQFQLDTLIEIEWARIPHFYSNFYVYQYATGIAAALNLHHSLKKNGAKFVTKYLKFLSSGSSEYPLKLLKELGIDFTTPKPIAIALSVFKDRLNALKKLL